MSTDLRFIAYRLAFIAGLVAAVAIQLCVVPSILNPWLSGSMDASADTSRWLDLAADGAGGLLAFLLAAPLPQVLEGLAGRRTSEPPSSR